MGVTLGVLSRAAPHRLHAARSLTIQLEGARLHNRTWAEVAAGANTLGVLHGTGEWELVQFIGAELIGLDRYRLSGLLRGLGGTEVASDGDLPAGAPVVLVDGALERARVSEAERGTELLWRAVPAGAAHPVLTSEQRFTWKGLHARPWSPAHLRAERTGVGGLRLRWTPRACRGWDSWDGEAVELETRLHQITVRTGSRVLRTWEALGTTAEYAAEALAADRGAAGHEPLWVEVRQGAAGFGWGAPARGAPEP